jgi:hypothetical protein
MVAAVTWLWHAVTTGDALTVTLLATMPPPATAVLVALALHSPFGELERTASAPLPALRLLHVSGLLLVATVALILATRSGASDGWTLARNVAGLAGLALLAASVAGSVIAWAVPLAYGALVVLAGASVPWAWPLWPIDDRSALTVAIALLLLGLIASGRNGLHEEAGETG